MKQEMMRQKMNFAQISRTALWLGLIVFANFAAARAQTVIPRVCFEAKPEILTRTLNNSVNAGTSSSREVHLNQLLPAFGFYAVVLNPGGATEERLEFSYTSGGLTRIYFDQGMPAQTILHNHLLGEPVLVISDGEAVYGYHNTSSTNVIIPRGSSSGNYFAPGPLVYSFLPTNFQPGVGENLFRMKAIAALSQTWFLNGGQAASNAAAGQSCATITYQGRLSDGGNAANGQFDLQFQAFDAATGGTAQSELITVQDVQVTNGIFTVPLFFGSTFTNNYKLRYLEIGVRPGTSRARSPRSPRASR